MKCVWVSEHDNLQSAFYGNAVFCLLFFKLFNGVEIERLGDTYPLLYFPSDFNYKMCSHQEGASGSTLQT